MVEGGFRHLLVVNGGELEGILSMRDIVRCWAARPRSGLVLAVQPGGAARARRSAAASMLLARRRLTQRTMADQGSVAVPAMHRITVAEQDQARPARR